MYQKLLSCTITQVIYWAPFFSPLWGWVFVICANNLWERCALKKTKLQPLVDHCLVFCRRRASRWFIPNWDRLDQDGDIKQTASTCINSVGTDLCPCDLCIILYLWDALHCVKMLPTSGCCAKPFERDGVPVVSCPGWWMSEAAGGEVSLSLLSLLLDVDERGNLTPAEQSTGKQ